MKIKALASVCLILGGFGASVAPQASAQSGFAEVTRGSAWIATCNYVFQHGGGSFHRTAPGGRDAAIAAARGGIGGQYRVTGCSARFDNGN